MALVMALVWLRFERAWWFDGDKNEDQGIRSTKKKNNEKTDVAPFRRVWRWSLKHETSGVSGVRWFGIFGVSIVSMSCINTSRSGRKMLLRMIYMDYHQLFGFVKVWPSRYCSWIAWNIFDSLAIIVYSKSTERCSGVNLGALFSVRNLLLFPAFQPICRKQQHSEIILNSWRGDSCVKWLSFDFTMKLWIETLGHTEMTDHVTHFFRVGRCAATWEITEVTCWNCNWKLDLDFVVYVCPFGGKCWESCRKLNVHQFLQLLEYQFYAFILLYGCATRREMTLACSPTKHVGPCPTDRIGGPMIVGADQREIETAEPGPKQSLQHIVGKILSKIPEMHSTNILIYFP